LFSRSSARLKIGYCLKLIAEAKQEEQGDAKQGQQEDEAEKYIPH
jgi:hypothetical protein